MLIIYNSFTKRSVVSELSELISNSKTIFSFYYLLSSMGTFLFLFAEFLVLLVFFHPVYAIKKKESKTEYPHQIKHILLIKAG